MKYTVVVKHIISTKGDHERWRYDNVNKRIINFLVKEQYNFSVGIINNIVNRPTAKNYIEIYTKGFYDENLKLFYKLDKYGKPKSYKSS